jgi:hypothetical protein
MPRAFALLAVTLAAAAAPLRAQIAAPMDSLELGRKATDWFYLSQTDSLWNHVADTTDWSSRSDFAARTKGMLQDLVGRAGFEDSLISEEFVKRHGQTQYWRTARFNLVEEPVMLRWVIVNGRIGGIGMNLAKDAPARD